MIRCSVAVLLLLTLAGVSKGWAAEDKPRAIGPEPQVFADDRLIASKDGVTRHAHACEKLPTPVLEPDAPGECDGDDQRIYIYGTVMRDPDSGQFRMWYNRLNHMLYATSEDGINWTRPDLGLNEKFGSEAVNCILDHCHSPSVVYNPEAPEQERYVALCSSRFAGRGYHIARSADGIHWEFQSHNPVVPSGDTCTLAFDENTVEYLAFHKRSHPYRGEEARRLVYLATTRDLQEWTKPVLVMAPDEVDDASVRAEGGRLSEFYNMSVFPYGGQFLGMVTHFRYTGPPPRKGPLQSGDDGPIDVQLVHSRDSRHWKRCEDRSPVIPNGPYKYDAGSILGVCNGPVVVDDELWMYYTAITTTHGGFVPEKRITIALAKWRMDGFVSLDAGEEEGVVETVPLASKGDHLVVNGDVTGSLTVALLDASGKPLPGYGHGDCVPVTGDSVRHAVSWRGHEAVPTDTPLRLQFRMKNAKLYSYTLD